MLKTKKRRVRVYRSNFVFTILRIAFSYLCVTTSEPDVPTSTRILKLPVLLNNDIISFPLKSNCVPYLIA